MIHTDLGCIAVANWYKPRCFDDEHITTFRSAISALTSEVIGFIIAGNLNIHHSRWLRFSNDITSQAILLKEICDDLYLHQLVSEPIRGKYLLDLCLTDVENCKVKSLPQIADHKMLHIYIFIFPCPRR